jgi:hypothetical protein
MPPRTRKGTTDPAGRATAPAKPARAKKAAAKKAASAAQKSAATPKPDAPRDDDLEASDVPDTEPSEAETGEPGDDLGADQVLSSDISTDSSRNTHVDADGTTVITTRSSRTDRTRREYTAGHTVDQTVTTATERVERIPVPYAGPVSEHPAPVG